MSIMIPAWDNGTLVPVEKLEAHQRGLRHKAISVFVMNGSKVLIQQRALSKYHTPGLWANTCCTHPHWDEAPLDCAQRRLDEELGIRGLTLSHADQVEYRADVGNDLIEHELVEIYTAHMAPDHPFEINPEEVAQTRWIELDALCAEAENTPEKFTPWLRIYLVKYKDRIFQAVSI